MLIVGPDEADIQKKMEVLLEHCIEQVHFMEFSDFPEDYMAAADVLCLPSYREGFGNVVIEAASVGIPAIGSKIYGVEDAIADGYSGLLFPGYSGLLFPVGNSAELSQCMERMATDIQFTKQLGSHARERVLEQFSSEYLASAWLAYYQDRL
jgi:glycosyltransferase involved in cell wall biosynthesis